MPIETYKCPNCSAGLIYDPKSGQFTCEYCNTQYDESTLAQPNDGVQPDTAAQAQPAEENDFSSQSLYICPSCGAEVIAEDTTAATFCLYCHNPVILSGKVEGSFKPDNIIPFMVDKSQLQNRFAEWCKSKKFIHDDFVRQAKNDMIKGVYFPFWVVDCKADAGMSARGEKVRSWRTGDTEYTETKVYTIVREGEISFNDITLKALDKQQTGILDGIHPFEMEKMQPFSKAFFSGFLAEKRNIEKDAAKGSVDQVVQDSSRSLLLDTMPGYSSLSVIAQKAVPKEENWLYVMLPAWMFNYKFKGEDYYFCMNGQTGKIAGRVPVSARKLLYLFLGLTAGITGIMLLIGGLL